MDASTSCATTRRSRSELKSLNWNSGFEVVQDSVSGDEVYQGEVVEPQEFVTDDVVLEDGLFITLLDDDEFYSGQGYTLRVLVSDRTAGEEKPLANVAVSDKNSRHYV